MIVWTVTLWEKNTAPSVFVYADQEAALDASMELRDGLNERGLSFREAVVYIQRHVVGEDIEEDE